MKFNSAVCFTCEMVILEKSHAEQHRRKGHDIQFFERERTILTNDRFIEDAYAESEAVKRIKEAFHTQLSQESRDSKNTTEVNA